MTEPFMIENESQADSYLESLFEKPEYRHMSEVKIRAQRYIKDDGLRAYFLNKARKMLKTYGAVR
jgi:hypothetical protein